MSIYVSSTPSRHRGRAYSLTQPVNYPYPATPYAGYSNLGSTYYDPPHNNKTYYVAPSDSGRGRSHSRPRHHGHSHHHSHRHHSHQRRSHSAASHRHHRPTGYYGSNRHHSVHFASLPRYHHSPTLGERILGFFGLKNNNRYADQHGHSVDNRGRLRTKY